MNAHALHAHSLTSKRIRIGVHVSVNLESIDPNEDMLDTALAVQEFHVGCLPINSSLFSLEY